MSKVYADNGYRIEVLGKNTDGTYDVTIDGVKADLKSTTSHNNIVSYAKHATRKQGAKVVLFEFDKMDKAKMGELLKLKKAGLPAKYYTKTSKKVVDV